MELGGKTGLVLLVWLVKLVVLVSLGCAGFGLLRQYPFGTLSRQYHKMISEFV